MNYIFYLVIIIIMFFYSCENKCELLGEKNLGKNFTLVEADKNNISIIYCTSKECCKAGFLVVPSKVKTVQFNNNWILARTINSESIENYWIINKNFKIDINNCDNISCDSILKANVTGPLLHSEFIDHKNKFNINFNLD